MAWYVYRDKVTNKAKRLAELSSQAKADAIDKYNVSLLNEPDRPTIEAEIEVEKANDLAAKKVLGDYEKLIQKEVDLDVKVKAIKKLKAEGKLPPDYPEDV